MASILSYSYLLLLDPFLMAEICRVCINISIYVRALISRVSPSQISHRRILICYKAGLKASHYDYQVLVGYKEELEMSFKPLQDFVITKSLSATRRGLRCRLFIQFT